MTRIMSFLAVAVLAMGTGVTPAQAQSTTSQALVELTPEQQTARQTDRQKRIQEHQQRVKMMLEQARDRREANQAGAPPPADEAPPEAAEVTTAAQAESATAADSMSNQARHRLEGWRSFWDFYKTPYDDSETVSYRGERQSYVDDAIEITWHLTSEDSELTRTRTISYRWKKFTDPEVTVDLPSESGTMLLARNGRSYMIEYYTPGQTRIDIKSFRHNATTYIATHVVAPLASGMVRPSERGIPAGQGRTSNAIGYIIGPTQTQIVNGWAFFLHEGQVYAEPSMDNRHLTQQQRIRIGNAKDDHRPVGDMMVRIEKMDPLTSSAEVVISEAFYPHTLFATDRATSISKVIQVAGGLYATKLEVLDQLSRHYGFEVRWVGDNTQQLAAQQRLTTLPSTNFMRHDAVLNWIEDLLGDDFTPIALGHKILAVELSRETATKQEFSRLAEQVRRDFKLETKLYSVKRITENQAIRVLKRDFLSCYAVVEPEPTDMTSETLIAQGDILAIVKRPIDDEDNPRRQPQEDSERKSDIVCERIDNDNTTARDDDGGELLVVTATAKTHERIAAWLKDIEAEAKQASVSASADEPAPERRRLQVVLLQGGKAGETAAVADESGTSVTYQAEVPAQFGMTPEDLKILGFDGAVVTGRGVVDLVAAPGKTGEAQLTLGGQFTVSVQYQQEQGGFLVVEGALENAGGDGKPLAQNTMMLEKGKPSFLGVTNLSGAVIAVVTWID